MKRNLEARRRDSELLARSIPDLQEYAGAVFTVMDQIGLSILVMHCEGGECELRRKVAGGREG